MYFVTNNNNHRFIPMITIKANVINNPLYHTNRINYNQINHNHSDYRQ